LLSYGSLSLSPLLSGWLITVVPNVGSPIWWPARAPYSAIPAAGTWEGKRIRRTGNELIEFRRMLKTDVKNGVPALRLQKNIGSALLTSISFECQTIFF
jgi:hypothetical protein